MVWTWAGSLEKTQSSVNPETNQFQEKKKQQKKQCRCESPLKHHVQDMGAIQGSMSCTVTLQYVTTEALQETRTTTAQDLLKDVKTHKDLRQWWWNIHNTVWALFFLVQYKQKHCTPHKVYTLTHTNTHTQTTGLSQYSGTGIWPPHDFTPSRSELSPASRYQEEDKVQNDTCTQHVHNWVSQHYKTSAIGL